MACCLMAQTFQYLLILPREKAQVSIPSVGSPFPASCFPPLILLLTHFLAVPQMFQVHSQGRACPLAICFVWHILLLTYFQACSKTAFA